MKLVSWNVNGLRSCIGKGFAESMTALDADCISLQEVKLSEILNELALPGYHAYWNLAEKKGYSGTALFTRTEPVHISYGMGIDEHDHEGRVVTAEYSDFYLVTCYTPNAQRDLARLEYRMRWEDDIRRYLSELDRRKPVVLCGDLNVAHNNIDIKNASGNRGNAGFTDEERAKFTELLSAGFTDTYRHFYPDQAGAYTWWSYMGKARANNTGWRIDYYCVSSRFMPRVTSARIHPDIMGSDHCPVEINISEASA